MINIYLAKKFALAIVVFIFYLIVFCFIVCRVPFFAKSGLHRMQLVVLFLLKIMAGVAYGFFYSSPAFRPNSDTWHIDEVSKLETNFLIHDPIGFIKDLYPYGYAHSGNLFAVKNSYWNDLKLNLIIKLDAIFNIFTLEHYYANLIFFNFLFFFGSIALYRAMKCIYPQKKWLLIGSIFLIPSFLFWCSGLHKDGLIFCCLGLIIYHFQLLQQQHKLLIKPLLICLFSFILLFALRNFMALLLVPALFVWLTAYLFPSYRFSIAVAVYAIGLILFFTLGNISPAIDFPQYIIDKQTAFKALTGNSAIAIPALHNSISSFIHFLPNAIDIGFLRPHLTEVKNRSYLPASIEIIILWLIVFISFFLKQKQPLTPAQSSFNVFAICFGFSFLLLSGYTVTFSGAIVRYRALVLPLLLIPFVQQLSWLRKK